MMRRSTPTTRGTRTSDRCRGVCHSQVSPPASRRARRDAEDQLRFLEDENGSLERQLHGLEERVGMLQREYDRAQQSLGVALADVRKQEELARVVEAQKKQVEEELRATQQLLTHHNGEQRQRLEEQKLAVAELAVLKGRQGALDKVVERQKEELRALHAVTAAATAKAELAERALAEERQARTAEREQADHQAEMIKGQKHELSLLAAHSHNLMRQAQEGNGALQARLQQLEEEHEAQRRQWQEESEKQQRTISKLYGERSALASIAQRAAQQLRELQEQGDAQLRRAEAAEAKFHDAEQKLDGAEGQRDSRYRKLEGELVMHLADKAQLSQQKKVAEELNTHLKRQLQLTMRHVNDVNAVATRVAGLMGRELHQPDRLCAGLESASAPGRSKPFNGQP